MEVDQKVRAPTDHGQDMVYVDVGRDDFAATDSAPVAISGNDGLTQREGKWWAFVRGLRVTKVVESAGAAVGIWPDVVPAFQAFGGPGHQLRPTGLVRQGMLRV